MRKLTIRKPNINISKKASTKLYRGKGITSPSKISLTLMTILG